MARPNNQPKLFIIAGPNGAGKSSTSKKILGPYNLEAFDWDAIFWNLFEKFDFDPIIERSIQDKASETFEEQIRNCFNKKENFAFETNFHGTNDLLWTHRAIEEGYRTYLIFFQMLSVDHCIQRVKTRVALGGHPISNETIHKRFFDGLKNLGQNYKLFDELRVFNASLEWEIDIMAEIIDYQVLYINKDYEAIISEYSQLSPFKSFLF